MTLLSEAKLVILDVETTGLSPAMGDSVVELGMVVCQGETEISRSSYLINPERLISIEAQRIHGISDQDVSQCLTFKEIAEEIKSTVVDSWIIGHDVRFDAGTVTSHHQSSVFCMVTARYPAGRRKSCPEKKGRIACDTTSRHQNFNWRWGVLWRIRHENKKQVDASSVGPCCCMRGVVHS